MRKEGQRGYRGGKQADRNLDWAAGKAQPDYALLTTVWPAQRGEAVSMSTRMRCVCCWQSGSVVLLVVAGVDGVVDAYSKGERGASPSRPLRTVQIQIQITHLEDLRRDDERDGAGVVERRVAKAEDLLISGREEGEQLPDHRHEGRHPDGGSAIRAAVRAAVRAAAAALLLPVAVSAAAVSTVATASGTTNPPRRRGGREARQHRRRRERRVRDLDRHHRERHARLEHDLGGLWVDLDVELCGMYMYMM